MRIEELKPGMVVRQKWDPWELLNGHSPDDWKIVYVVPSKLDFEKQGQGFGYGKRSVRVPILNVHVIRFVEDLRVTGEVSVTVEPHPNKSQLAVPGRELIYVADTMGDAMSVYAAKRRETRERETEREALDKRCRAAYETIERLTGHRSHQLDHKWNLTDVSVPLEVMEQLVFMADSNAEAN